MPTISALGTTLEVVLGGGVDAGEFEAAWSRCLVAGIKHPRSASVGPAGGMVSLTQSITRALIEQRRGELLMLHAGAVSHPETGASVAYVAPGGTGKTTLSRLLGQRYGYLTDETVGIEPGTWRIEPYEKPLSLRTPDGGFPKHERSPDELGLRPAHTEPWLSRLVLLRRTPDLTESRFTKLDLFDAIPMLTSESSSLVDLPQPLHILEDLERGLGGIWLAEYGEAHQLVEWMTESLES